jgi:hypothetical protein
MPRAAIVVEDGLAERGDEPARKVRANALDHARAQIAADTLDRGRRYHLQETRAELQPMLTVLLPLPACLDALAGVHLGGGPKHRHEVPVAAHLDAQHAKASFGAVERHAFNKA